jgi:hypothetical protein
MLHFAVWLQADEQWTYRETNAATDVVRLEGSLVG